MKRKLVSAYFVIMLFIIAITLNYSFAYLTDSSHDSIPFVVGDVKVNVRVSFENNGQLIQASEVEIVPGVKKNGVYLVNISDNNSPQFIEKLRIYFDVYSSVNTYFRIKLVEQLTLTRISTSGEVTELAVLMEQPMDFLYENNWYNNRSVDDYLYYKNKVKYIDENNPTTIGLITKYYDDKYFAARPLGYSLQIGILIEAVQAEMGPLKNWKLSQTPWGGAW